jgi:hypothetical protein
MMNVKICARSPDVHSESSPYIQNSMIHPGINENIDPEWHQATSSRRMASSNFILEMI